MSWTKFSKWSAGLNSKTFAEELAPNRRLKNFIAAWSGWNKCCRVFMSHKELLPCLVVQKASVSWRVQSRTLFRTQKIVARMWESFMPSLLLPRVAILWSGTNAQSRKILIMHRGRLSTEEGNMLSLLKSSWCRGLLLLRFDILEKCTMFATRFLLQISMLRNWF